MTKKLNPKRAFGSLFTSLGIHLLVFIVLGFIFLRGKSYEEYVELNFTARLPEPERKLQTKKMITKLKSEGIPHYENLFRRRVPEISTAAKINLRSDVYLSPVPSEDIKNPTMSVPKVHRITIPKTKVQSKTEVSFTKPEITHKNQIAIASLSVTSAELKLPSDFSISEKIDIDVDAIQRYRSAIKRKIEEEKRYPDLAEKNGYEGKVNIKFKLFADGSIKEVKISKSSGYQILDREAVRAVTSAVPYPPMPQSIKREYIFVEVPIVFKLS